MGFAQLKSARMELKTTDAAKELLSFAAALNGTDLTAFVLEPAMEKARKIVAEHHNIALNLDGQLKLASVLRHPAPPTEALRNLMNTPDLPQE